MTDAAGTAKNTKTFLLVVFFRFPLFLMFPRTQFPPVSLALIYLNCAVKSILLQIVPWRMAHESVIQH